MKNKIAVGDADGLVALADDKDANHNRARRVSEWLLAEGYQVIFPNTAILEAVTALKRAKNLPEKAHLINKQYQAGAFHVEYVTREIMHRASELFDNTISKQNTFFDAIVAATAEHVEADAVFSFDGWYKKVGLVLVSDLLVEKG